MFPYEEYGTFSTTACVLFEGKKNQHGMLDQLSSEDMYVLVAGSSKTFAFGLNHWYAPADPRFYFRVVLTKYIC